MNLRAFADTVTLLFAKLNCDGLVTAHPGLAPVDGITLTVRHEHYQADPTCVYLCISSGRFGMWHRYYAKDVEHERHLGLVAAA